MTRRLIAGIVLMTGLALAQPKPNLVDRLQRMTPAERQRFLDRIPPDKRMQLERRMRELDKIPTDVRDRLRREYDEFQQLPPERQQAVRRVLREMNGLPPGRRGAVRAAVNFIRGLSAADRERRFQARPFKTRFDEDEQRLIKEAVDVLPPLPAEEPPASNEQ